MLLPMLGAVAALGFAGDAPKVTAEGDWSVKISPGEVQIGGKVVKVEDELTLTIVKPFDIPFRDEPVAKLPLYDEKAAPWGCGLRLDPVITSETTAPDILRPGSFVLKDKAGAGTKFVAGKDYKLNERWGTIGRLTGGAISEGQEVFADYDIEIPRIDSVVVNAEGEVSIVLGEPHNATPKPPALPKDVALLANVWVPALATKITDEHIYPIVETSYPKKAATTPAAAAALLPKTWAKLQAGQAVHVLAWGDSVTAGGEASKVENRYQNRFVTLLQAAFPKAAIKLTTAGWGGRNSDSFLKEPAGAEFNFDKAVIAPKPDLVVSEFVNDAYMTPAQVQEKYGALLQRFKAAGAEWTIITPHFVWPEWMGEKTVRVEKDPRPYVAGLRQFAAANKVALADASLRWGHLVKEGIPYTTLLVNSLNHPDDRGHEMFAQSLMDLFRGSAAK